jgi:hypothetical protein
MPDAPGNGRVTPPVRAADAESPRTAGTEIVLAGGERIRTQEQTKDVEAAILSAARGSIMELAWVMDAQTGERVGINPDHVVTLRELATGAGPA